MPSHPHRHLAACLLSAALLFAAAGASTPPAPRGPSDEPAPAAHEPAAAPNAALVYWPHWSRISDDAAERLRAAYTEDERKDPAWTPDDDLTDLVEDLGPAVLGLMRAAAIPACDFGLERHLGFDLHLLHLGRMRTGARLLAIDARRLAASGEHDAAAARVAALFRSAAHARTDGFMISSLVACGLTDLALWEARHLVESGRLGEPAKADLRAAAAALTGDDPFGFKAALAAERDWTAAAVREQGIAPYLDTVDPAAGPASEDDELTITVSSRLIEMAAGAYDAALAVWDDEDAAAKLEDVQERAGAGGWGLVAAISMPPLVKSRASQSAMEDRLRWLLAALEPEGDAAPDQ